MSAVWADVPVDVPLKFKILELPFAGSPILGLLFVQVNWEPMVAVKATAIFSPAHLLISPGFVNTGTGSIVTVKSKGVPVQPLLVGVTTKLLVCPTVEGTVGTEIFPEPEADMPVSVLLFVQLYVVVDKLPLNVKLMGVPPHILWLGKLLTVGTWPKLIFNVWLAPTQPSNVGVTVMTADCPMPPGVWVVKEIPAVLPEAGRPMSVLLFVQA